MDQQQTPKTAQFELKGKCKYGFTLSFLYQESAFKFGRGYESLEPFRTIPTAQRSRKVRGRIAQTPANEETRIDTSWHGTVMPVLRS